MYDAPSGRPASRYLSAQTERETKSGWVSVSVSCASMAVSYTHLDVYKRQLNDSPNGTGITLNSSKMRLDLH